MFLALLHWFIPCGSPQYIKKYFHWTKRVTFQCHLVSFPLLRWTHLTSTTHALQITLTAVLKTQTRLSTATQLQHTSGNASVMESRSRCLMSVVSFIMFFFFHEGCIFWLHIHKTNQTFIFPIGPTITTMSKIWESQIYIISNIISVVTSS